MEALFSGVAAGFSHCDTLSTFNTSYSPTPTKPRGLKARPIPNHPKRPSTPARKLLSTPQSGAKPIHNAQSKPDQILRKVAFEFYSIRYT
jgi:hypothetical protein